MKTFSRAFQRVYRDFTDAMPSSIMRILMIAFAFICLSGQAWAADLSVVVRTPQGEPVADAVASFVPAVAGKPATPIRFAWPMTMTQEHLQFSPFVLIVPVGSDVIFPNHDNVRHHVYSFS